MNRAIFTLLIHVISHAPPAARKFRYQIKYIRAFINASICISKRLIMLLMRRLPVHRRYATSPRRATLVMRHPRGPRRIERRGGHRRSARDVCINLPQTDSRYKRNGTCVSINVAADAEKSALACVRRHALIRRYIATITRMLTYMYVRATRDAHSRTHTRARFPYFLRVHRA